MATTHKDLLIWQLGIELALETHKATMDFPKEQGDGLAAEMRRTALAVPSRISEGAARDSKNEAIQFLYSSLGSIAELESHAEVAGKLGFMLSPNKITKLTETLREKLIGSIDTLKA